MTVDFETRLSTDCSSIGLENPTFDLFGVFKNSAVDFEFDGRLLETSQCQHTGCVGENPCPVGAELETAGDL